MPVNQKLMDELIKKYGKKEGRRIYFAMEQKGHKATKPSAIRKAMEG
jgi:hypothetical protein